MTCAKYGDLDGDNVELRWLKEIVGVGLHWCGKISILTATIGAGLGIRWERFMFVKTNIRSSVHEVATFV